MHRNCGATAPHVVDPKNPGAVDEIINLGQYWDEIAIAENKLQIIATNKEVGRLFKRAYSILASARKINDDMEAMNSRNLDKLTANKIARDLISTIVRERKGDKLGKERHLFASAITPDGCVDYLETVVGECTKKYYIKGEPGTGRSTLLSKVYRAAIEAGYDAEAYHCAFEPSKIEHVVIPDLDIALTTSPKFSKNSTAALDMDKLKDEAFIVSCKYDIEYDKNMLTNLISESVKTLHRAKETHDYMEDFYVPHMDFDRINRLREQILNRIMYYTQRQ